MRHFKYLGYVIRHKWFVLWECWKRGLIWRGIIHDWHKLLPCEWFPYVHSFYGERTAEVRSAFDLAWLRHQRRSDHHPEWWLLPIAQGGHWTIQSHSDLDPMILAKNNVQIADIRKQPDDNVTYDASFRIAKDMTNRLNGAAVKPLSMSRAARLEMLCDWIGAGLAQGKGRDVVSFWERSRDKFCLHADTRNWIEHEISNLKGEPCEPSPCSSSLR